MVVPDRGHIASRVGLGDPVALTAFGGATDVGVFA